MSPCFSPFPLLHTDRLLLRALEASDVNALYALRSDPQVLHYLDRDPPASMADVEKFMADVSHAIAQNENIMWAIQPRDQPVLAGTIGFFHMNVPNYRSEIGYALLPEYWGKGFMSEALKAALDYGFNQMGLHSVEATINPNNAASRAVLVKSGFVQEAYFRENYFYQGKFHDTAILSLLNPNRDHVL